MPRKKCYRHITINPEITCFKPQGIPRKFLASILLELDEIESIRFKDLNGFNQAKCAQKMNVSISTFQRIINSAHQKVAQALLGGKSIIINTAIMPNRNGTGPLGQGPRTGRGLGNCSPDPNRNQAGPDGFCICPSCGEKLEHVTGQPCYQQKCPKCEKAMIREA